MEIREILKQKINNNYKIISTVINTSEWQAKEIIENEGEISLIDLQKLLDYFNIKFTYDFSENISYEISTEINSKIFRNYAGYWLEKKKYEIRESTFANYTNLFVNNILPCLGDIPCEKFNNMFKTKEEKIEFTSKYKGNVCCINKKTRNLDFVGTIKDVADYLAERTNYICDVINGITDDEIYEIIPKIEGITHKNNVYMGG